MSVVLAAALLAVALPAPKAGHYYREAFAEAYAKGAIDPDAYTAHREPSLRLTPPRVSVDHGQSVIALELRSSTTGTVTAVSAREPGGAWRPITLEVLGPDRLRTDLGGQLETWVRLPGAFEALVARAREAQTRSMRASLAGRYASADGATITLKSGFRLTRCLESCQGARAWCVTHQRKLYVVEGRELVEAGPPEGLCPDAPAFERVAGARRYARQ